jgi:hypothetical protein
MMPRALTLLFRRDPSRDRHRGTLRFEGYRILWPDGQPASVGVDAFCVHAQRLLGLGRHLAGRAERLVELLLFPLADPQGDMTKLPGHRVRRFYLERRGAVGRIHFMDGTPTEAVADIGRDDRRVLEWVGVTRLRPGERQWFDLAARPVEDAENGDHVEELALSQLV